MLQFNHLYVQRNGQNILEDLQATFSPGKVYALLGANGAGKSSLLNVLFGDMPFQGEIRFGGEKLHLKRQRAWKKHLAYMPQDHGMQAQLSVLEVVLLGLFEHLNLYVDDAHIQRALNMMEQLGILHLAERNVMSLSGGQRQMVMFASVIIKNPAIILLDEPVSALDLHHQCVLLEKVRRHTRQHQSISIMVLHDLSLAAQFCDEILILHEKNIHARGTAREVFHLDLIRKIYRVHGEIFYDRQGLPHIAVQSAAEESASA